MGNAAVDIVVLTWDQKALLSDFVESFIAHTDVACRLIIIDNGSSDGTDAYLQSLQETASVKITRVLNKENKGFVEGMNQGLALSDAPYVCLANNDLLFSDGWLNEIIAIFDKDPRIGVLNPNSNNLGQHPPDMASIDEYASKINERHRGAFVEMPFCIGFCMVIRREVLKKIGGLSVEFKPMFFEDSDFSMKAAQAGYLLGMAQGSYVWHKEHASIRQLTHTKRERIFNNSKAAFDKKWGRTLRIAWFVPEGCDMRGVILDAVAMARHGNYIWIMGADIPESRAGLFKDYSLTEHTGVHPVRMSAARSLLFVLFKKKRHDIVISASPFMRLMLNVFGFKVMPNFDHELLQKARF